MQLTEIHGCCEILLLHLSGQLWATRVNKCLTNTKANDEKCFVAFTVALVLPKSSRNSIPERVYEHFVPHIAVLFSGRDLAKALCSLCLNESCNTCKGNIWQVCLDCWLGHFLIPVCFGFSNVLMLDRKSALTTIAYLWLVCERSIGS